MKEQIEEMEMTPLDVLANDINQHCSHLAENYCGDTHCVACLANALYNAGYIKIVPCKDCEHFYKVGSVGICRHWNFHSTKDDAYCSFAKMKGCAE